MGYRASCNGDVVLSKVENEEKIIEAASQIFEDFTLEEKTLSVYSCGSDNYHEDLYYEFFNILDKFAGIEEGVLELVGSDDERWRFVYNRITGKWDQEDGYTYYKHDYNSPSYEQLVEMFVAYVSNDLVCTGDPDYIVEALEKAGCSAKAREALGLDFPKGGED